MIPRSTLFDAVKHVKEIFSRDAEIMYARCTFDPTNGSKAYSTYIRDHLKISLSHTLLHQKAYF